MSTVWRVLCLFLCVAFLLQFSGVFHEDIVLTPAAYLRPRMDTPEQYRPRTETPEQYRPRTETPEHYKLKTCSGTLAKPPAHLRNLTADIWQRVINNKHYVFSAYTDPRARDQTIIRFIGLSRERKDTRTSLVCQVWLPDNTMVYTEPVQLELMTNIVRDSNTYISCAYVCSIRNKTDYLPEGTRVSLAESACQTPTNMLRLHINRLANTFPEKFHACLCGPLKHYYQGVDYFRQWLEVQAIYGASRFTAYQTNISEAVQKLIDPYVAGGVMDVYPWILPSEIHHPSHYIKVLSLQTTWNLAQVASIHDCLYRHMFTSEYIVFTDLDELIVPRCAGCRTWADMMKAVRREEQCPTESFFAFRNVFFSGVENDLEISNVSDRRAFMSVVNTMREGDFDEYHYRTKYIVNPREVLYANVHSVYKMWSSVGKGLDLDQLCVVDRRIGALHHYKSAKYKNFNSSTSMQDVATHTDKDAIIKRITLALNGTSLLL